MRQGDTLASIARAVWGDESLWYLIADANGLVGNDILIEGQVLTVPNKVSNFHNNATTFKVYNAGQAIGDSMPVLPPEPMPPPPPAKKGGCGVLGTIIMAVVAVAVVYLTAGATINAAATMLGETIAVGAAASTAATVLGGAVSAGVMNTSMGPSFSSSTSAFARGVVQGGISSTITQGVAVATGLQHSFSWRGVAAGAIASGVGAEIGNAIGQAQYGEQAWARLNGLEGAARDAVLWGDLGKTMVRSAATGLATGVASSLVRGGSLRSNLPGIMQDAIAGAVGNAIRWGAQAAQAMAQRVAIDAFGNALGESLASAMRPTDAPTERYAAQSAKYEADLNADVQAILNQPSGINVKGLIDAVPMPSYAPGASADSDFAGYEWADQFGNGKPNLDLARVRYVQGGPRKSADAAEAAGYQRELEDFNRANGWYNDGLVMRMMPRKGPSDTGQRLEPRTGDGLLSSERYLRDNGFIDPRAGTLEYDVGRRLIEDIGIAGAPEAAIGLIPARVTAAASRYMGAAGEFVLGEQRMAKLALAGEMRAGLQFGDATLGQGYGSASSLYLDDSTNLLTFRASSMYSPSNSDLSRLALDGFKRSGEPVFRTGEGLAASEFERAFGGMLDRITPDSWPHPNPPDFMIKGGQYDGKTVDFLYVKTRLVINTFNE